MALSPGSTIGPFQIERQLGRGGMGEVYLAQDTRLARRVAIKALPDHLSADADRLARLQREARVLAALNHSGIGSIYGVEESSGHWYLILEYIEGQTLADRLARGPLPVDEAMDVARQIAEALEAAHEKGVIHRDLKPSNVMVTAEGAVKVLDFGLARTSEVPASTSVPFAQDSPTVSVPALMQSPTIPGAIMGTAGYMSPEQARGRAVDKRSDVFSFGCVLYEMLTGAAPFRGETVADVIASTLHQEPDFSRLPPSTPPRLRELMELCLIKDRASRLRDIGDARLQLQRAAHGRDSLASGSGIAVRRRISPVALALAALLLLGAGWLAASSLAPRAAPIAAAIPVSLFIPSAGSEYLRARLEQVSPDGRSVLFRARSKDSLTSTLWVRPLDSFEARPLADTDGAAGAFWSSDSRSVAFHADGKLWALDVDRAGSKRLITAEGENYGAAWGADGVIIMSRVTSGQGLVRISAAGGEAVPLTQLDMAAAENMHLYPHFLPDGVHYIFLAMSSAPGLEAQRGRLYLGKVGSAERTFIADVHSGAWYADPGWLVYADEGTIKAMPFDLASKKVTGSAITIADGVDYFRTIGKAGLSVSRNGVIAFTPPDSGDELVWFDATGKRLGTIGPTGSFAGPRISPDGSQVAVSVADRRTGQTDIWLYGIRRPTTTRLTASVRMEIWPVWSRDGSTLFFSADTSDTPPSIFAIPAEGGAARHVFGTGKDGFYWMCSDASADKKTLLVTSAMGRRGQEMAVATIDGGEAAPLRSSPADELEPRFSPDEKWIAYSADDSGQREVYIAPYAGSGGSGGGRVQVSSGGATPVWSHAGNRLYYRRFLSSMEAMKSASGTSAIMAVDLPNPESFASPQPARVVFETPERIEHFDVTADDKQFLVHTAPFQTAPIRVMLNALPPRH